MTLMSAMDAVKAQGIPIRCFVPVYAASMAFHILGNCTERYALHYTLLLFHPARITGDKRGMTQDELVYHAARMKVEEDELDGRLRRALRMDPVLFAYHHQHETFWLAQEFTSVAPGFIVIVDTYENVPGAFKMEE
jgi:ATP-dependent protease ClpP protease subunit